MADLMIEAKDKEQAVFHLFRIYNLQPTIYGAVFFFFFMDDWTTLIRFTDSLRPPVLQETTQTAGRKSSKRKAPQDPLVTSIEESPSPIGKVKSPRPKRKSAKEKDSSAYQDSEDSEESVHSGSPVALRKRRGKASLP